MKRRPLPPLREEATQKQTWRTYLEHTWTINILVFCVGVICYLNSLSGDFVHDDIPAIVTNPDVTGQNRIGKSFWNDFWGTPMSDPASHKSYRPLTTLSFRLNYFHFGLTSWWWHITNVLTHGYCCILVARTGAEVARLRTPFSGLAALLFAVHPVHTEAVAGVVGRADVLACILFLSSLLRYHGNSGKPKVWSSILLSGASMLAKETGLTVLLFHICFDIYKSRNMSSRSSPARWRWKAEGVSQRLFKLTCSLVVLASLRLLLLHGSLPAFSAQDNPPAFHPSFIVRTLTFWYLAAFNWYLMLCPTSLSHDWQMGSVPLVTSLVDPRNLVTVAMIVVLSVVCYSCILDFESQRRTPQVVGLLLLVLPYLPASNLFVTVGFVLAERVLYIPSVGLAILTAYGIQLLWQRRHCRRWLTCAIVILAASGAAKTYLRNRDWRTRETLLRADLKVLPHNAKLHYNFGNYLKDMEQQESAIKHYKEALRLWPSYASAHNNLGTLLVASGQAEHHFLQALKCNSNHINAHYNLGKLYRKKNHLTEAQSMLQRCIYLAPNFVQAHLELLLLTPEEEKREILQKLLQLEPKNWEHYLLYGNWLKKKGWLYPSLKYYVEAMRWSFTSPKDRSRGDLHSLRTTCLLLRDLGQHARILQLVTRWQTWHSSVSTSPILTLSSRARQIRAELSRRATRYDKVMNKITPSCLHHTIKLTSSIIRNYQENEQSSNYDTNNKGEYVNSSTECQRHNCDLKESELLKTNNFNNYIDIVNKSTPDNNVNNIVNNYIDIFNKSTPDNNVNNIVNNYIDIVNKSTPDNNVNNIVKHEEEQLKKKSNINNNNSKDFFLDNVNTENEYKDRGHKEHNSNVSKKGLLIAQNKLHNKSDIGLKRKSHVSDQSNRFKREPNYDTPYFHQLMQTL